MAAHDDLVAWADYCAKLARDTPSPQFSEPLLTEIRLGWDRVIGALQAEASIEAVVDRMRERGIPPYACDDPIDIAWPRTWRPVRGPQEGQP